jgi:formylglycine-generating enzyme required for sulfatase activity
MTEQEKLQKIAQNNKPEQREWTEPLIDMESESPRHAVTFKTGFWMAKYPVTQAQWLAVIKQNPSTFDEKKVGKNWRQHPVENVSWDDAQEFLKKLNAHPPQSRLEGGKGVFRLPSEAEWEYACRAGSETLFCFGDDVSQLKDYAWYYENSHDRTHPVGQLQPNDWGLYDMHGNVWEWCMDMWHGNYDGAPPDGSAWEGGGSDRVFRGGSWLNEPGYVRSANHDFDVPAIRFNNVGFRLVRTM